MPNPLKLTPAQEERLGFKLPKGAELIERREQYYITRGGPERVRHYDYRMPDGDVRHAVESTMVYQGPPMVGRRNPAVLSADEAARDASRHEHEMTHGDQAGHLHPIGRTDPDRVDNITPQNALMNNGFQKAMDADIDKHCAAHPNQRFAVCRIEVTSERKDAKWGRHRPMARQTQVCNTMGQTPEKLRKWTDNKAQGNFINAPGDAVSAARDRVQKAALAVKRAEEELKKAPDALAREDAKRRLDDATKRAAAEPGVEAAKADKKLKGEQRRAEVAKRNARPPTTDKDAPKPTLTLIEGGGEANRIKAEKRLYWSRYNGSTAEERSDLEKDWNSIRRGQRKRHDAPWEDKTDARVIGRSGEPENPSVPAKNAIDWDKDTLYAKALKDEQRTLRKDMEGKTVLLYSGKNPETGISNRNYALQHMANNDPKRPGRHISFGGTRGPDEPKATVDFDKLSEKRKQWVLNGLEKRYVEKYEFRDPSNKYVMIDHTRLGRDMNEARLYPPRLSDADKASLSPKRSEEYDRRMHVADTHWRFASRNFSRSASGTGIAFDYGASGERVYAKIESPSVGRHTPNFLSNAPDALSKAAPRGEFVKDGRSRAFDLSAGSGSASKAAAASASATKSAAATPPAANPAAPPSPKPPRGGGRKK